MKNFYDILGLDKSIAMTQQEEMGEETETAILKGKFQIKKAEDEKRLAFGWASVALEETGEQLIDWQKDMVEPEELEGRIPFCKVIPGRRGNA